MKILTLEELGLVVEHESVAYIMTTGKIHEGHLNLCKKAKLLVDELVTVFISYTRNFSPIVPDYSSFYSDDCKKLDGVSDYVINVEYDDEMDKLFTEHKIRCSQLDWDKYRHPHIHHENFVKHYTITTLLLPYERLLWKTKFRINGEKCLLPVTFDKMLQRILYPDIVPVAQDIFFPCERYTDNGCVIDSSDYKAKNLNEKSHFADIIKEIKVLISKDMTGQQIMDSIGLSVESVIILFWSGKELVVVNRPSECVPDKFMTVDGQVDGSILALHYMADNVKYAEQYLFDSCGRFVLDA